MRTASHTRLAALLLCLLLQPVALASKDGDQDRARAALQAGEVLPLPRLLERLQLTHPGQVLELELERDDGRWIYEVKLLQAGGRLLKLEVDARTAEVLRVKGKPLARDKANPPPKAGPADRVEDKR